ncbi:MAG: glycosyltransferase family A protein [Hyphomicrobiales bacterium]|nr:glycosyltransferase family A protein [Hyphomicrobiales bacterium]
MMLALSVIAIIFGLIPVCNTIANCLLLRRPPLSLRPSSVSILIPARDEESTIAASIDAALANRGIEIEVIVLDDGSKDRTAAIVAERASKDDRLRLAHAPALPPEWKGKPHACHVLAGLARSEFLLFVDADVRLSPDAASRLASTDADLVSGVPRQILGGVFERAIIPMINSLIYGYLPISMMRSRPSDTSLTAACGQLMMVRRASYEACGGHRAVATAMHDGLQLARHFRRSGFRTDLIDGTLLASCRMYDTPSAVWNGFSKNATEGMAKPVALPVWTVLLAGGWLLPGILLAAAMLGASVPAVSLLAGLVLVQISARAAQAFKCREPASAVALHPVGVILTLAIQWHALVAARRGKLVEWRGRSYRPSTE